MSGVGGLKHITEASDEAFQEWLRDQPLPMVDDKFSLQKIENLLHAAWNAARTAPRVPDEGVTELIAEARKALSFGLNDYADPYTLIGDLADALSALSSPTPGDEELLDIIKQLLALWNRHSRTAGIDYPVILRAVAALTSTEGNNNE